MHCKKAAITGKRNHCHTPAVKREHKKNTNRENCEADKRSMASNEWNLKSDDSTKSSTFQHFQWKNNLHFISHSWRTRLAHFAHNCIRCTLHKIKTNCTNRKKNIAFHLCAAWATAKGIRLSADWRNIENGMHLLFNSFCALLAHHHHLYRITLSLSKL